MFSFLDSDEAALYIWLVKFEACKTLVLGEDDAAAHQLASLGIPLGVLEDAARVGEFARDNCSTYHPLSFRGTASWADTIRALAESLVGLGWTRQDPSGLPLLVSPDGSNAISVQLGDELTAHRHALPRTKYPKGDATREAVRANSSLPLPGMEYLMPKEKFKVLSRQYSVWFFLRHRIEGSDRVKLELSKPRDLTDGGIADDWSLRIILGNVPLSPEPPISRRAPLHGGDAAEEQIDVPVTRK